MLFGDFSYLDGLGDLGTLDDFVDLSYLGGLGDLGTWVILVNLAIWVIWVIMMI